MVSDINAPRPPDEANADAQRLRDAAAREASSAREEAGKAGNTVADEASRLASQAREKAYEGAESGKAYAAGSLNDFTAAIKKASDELGDRDQSMAANLVREAASGLEQVSGAIEGKSIQDLTRSVAGFARRQPAAFLIGAALAGVAIGRFAKASSEHTESDYAGNGDVGRDWRGSAPSHDEGYRARSREGYASAGSRSPSSSEAGTGSGFGASSAGSPSRPSTSSTSSTSPGASTPGQKEMGQTTRPGSVPGPETASSAATTPASSGLGATAKGGDHER